MSSFIKPIKPGLQMSRRGFLNTAGTASALAMMRPGMSMASGNPLVIGTFGTESNIWFDKAWAKPFTAATGKEVVLEGVNPLDGKIIAMVESGKTVWDLCDSDGYSAIRLGRMGYLEEIDYSVVDKSKVREGWAWQHGIANHSYSYVRAVDTRQFDGDQPKTWGDFFDTKTFPGKRSVWRYMVGALEGALMADGVPADQLYPLDIKRAIAKLKTIEDDLIFWNNGADAFQQLVDSEVAIGFVWHNRALRANEATNGAISWDFDQGLFCPASWVMPKGGSQPEVAQQFIASSLVPERQKIVFDGLASGTTNPAAETLMSAQEKLVNPGTTKNLGMQIQRDEYWYADNYDDALNAFLDSFS
ncbi:extracellular solute-binding protein [Epibacterium sp. Ofav1-8]|uniref:extracellular solute-binding protein n=1 Tax=Epibacterium sp. Ofav1-8 TaxID=2917735 RepID=UPI001EF467E4|nr:extracellular solute-binding protein [Epibacterium sp. Ofav1-8]MCG7625168.1 extracellular solute-binding protein [Epibacterium sp. Ofav1-8]